MKGHISKEIGYILRSAKEIDAYNEGLRVGLEMAADAALEHCCPYRPRRAVDLPHLCARDIARAIRAIKTSVIEDE